MKKITILTVILALCTTIAYSADVKDLKPIDDKSTGSNSQNTNSVPTGLSDKTTIYYPNANMKSIIAKYKAKNYTGCLQELFSFTKKNPSNALAYYYMAMCYANINMKDEAVQAYEKVLTLNPSDALEQYAIKGRDCLTDGPACKPVVNTVTEVTDALDDFINAPYGNGFSPELNKELKQKQLTNIKDTINRKDNLDHNDIQKIRKFDNNQSFLESDNRIAMASDEDILNAVKTLKDAGVNVVIQPENTYSDPRMTEMNMLLGNNNSSMNMLPAFMLQQQQAGKNIDPQVMQAMIMNSMIPDFSFNDNSNNRY